MSRPADSTAFYATMSEVIPTLLVVIAIEARAFLPARTARLRVLDRIGAVAALTIIVIGEIVALRVVQTGEVGTFLIATDCAWTWAVVVVELMVVCGLALFPQPK